MNKLKTANEIKEKLCKSENISDIIDGDCELEGYMKGWRVGYHMGVLQSFQKNKDEAIKWIKELRKDCPKGISPMRVVGKNRLQHIEFIEHWIKHFFNITERELK